jgi:hypothetical protein
MYRDRSLGEEAAATSGLPDSMRLHTSELPLAQDIIDNYDPTVFNVAIFANNYMMDNDGAYSNPSIVQPIFNMLAQGKKVYVSSNLAGSWAFVGNTDTKTDLAQSFFLDTLGVTFRTDKTRLNSQQTAYVSFPIAGTANDPIGNGINVTANAAGAVQGDAESSLFTVPATGPTTSIFYADGAKTSGIGFKYQSTSGARLVYLGFSLNALSNQTTANTIFTRSINWLLGSSAGVSEQPVASSEGMTAMPNPFHGSTEVRYTAAQDERDVTFSAFDLLGREVSKLPAQNLGGNTYSATFNASELANGTYVIVAHSSKGTHDIRIVNQQ